MVLQISVVQSYYAKLRKVKSEMDQLDERMAKLKVCFTYTRTCHNYFLLFVPI